MVSNLGQPGLSKMGGAAWLLLQLCVGQCACWRWMLEIDAVAIKSLMSGTYITMYVLYIYIAYMQAQKDDWKDIY